MTSGAIGGKPCGSNSNVLRQLGPGPLWDSAMHVVVALDTDRLHDRVPGVLSRRTIADGAYGSWVDTATAEIRKHAPQAVQSQLAICLLDRNMEDLLTLAGRGTAELPRALRKDLMARDRILHRAAADAAVVQEACDKMPSWGQLVATVTGLVQSNMS